jgi:hypothetical protein
MQRWRSCLPIIGYFAALPETARHDPALELEVISEHSEGEGIRGNGVQRPYDQRPQRAKSIYFVRRRDKHPGARLQDWKKTLAQIDRPNPCR